MISYDLRNCLPASQTRPVRHKTFRTLFASVAFILLVSMLPYVCNAQVVRTAYTTIVSAKNEECLDIDGPSSSAGASAIHLPCNFGSSEEWTIQPYSAGGFRIIQQLTGNCLVVSGNSAAPGAQIVLEPCSGASGELWSFPVQGSNFQLVNVNSGQCASVSGQNFGDAANIVQQRCSTAVKFLWSFVSGIITPSSPIVAQAAHSGQCLVVSGASQAAGGLVVQSPCAGVSNEAWTLQPVGSYYEVISQNSGLCLSNNGNITQGTQIVQEACSGTPTSNLWTLKPVGGSYELITNSGGLCLDVASVSQVAGGKVIAWPCSAALNQLWSLSAASLPSSWTPVIPLAVNAIGVANLPNANLVMWSAYDLYTYESDIGNSEGQTYTAVFNPTTLASTAVLVTNTGDDMFCPATANLFDGSILVNGGSSSPKTSIYNPTTGLWTSDANMNIRRGYEGDTVLTNGSVLTLGGSWSGGLGGKNAEVWTEGGVGWQVLSGVPETPIVGPDPQGIFRGDNHLWMFTAPNGLVFHAGPSAAMHWIDPSGIGTITNAGNRSDDPFAINGNAVLYDVGQIMKAGGAPAYQSTKAEANTYLINLNKGTSGVPVTKIAPMAYPRAFSSGVVLPNGQVVIVGGQTNPLPFSDATAILIPELWDPLTHVFRQLSPMQTPRVYHSTGILLADGRVFSGGGGQCGQGCSANHFNTEILSPPYLLNADGSPADRPAISSAPASTVLGSTMSVTTDSPVVSFVLMRLSSNTHTVNNDQRRIPLQVQNRRGNTYTLEIPANPGIVLPGYYWLFALNSQGVPSVATAILIS